MNANPAAPPRSPHVSIGHAQLAVLTVLAVLAVVPSAEACPDCAIGRQARSEVLNGNFGYNLLVASLPFLIICGICARVEAIGRVRGAGTV